MIPRLLPRLAALAAAAVAPLVAAPHRLAVDHATSHVKFFARATLHTVEGHIERWDLELTIPEGAELPDAVVFTGDGTTMTTDHARRDEEMHRWMEHATQPTVLFRLRRFTGSADARVAEGDLTLRGVTVPVAFPIAMEREGARLTVTGTALVDVTNFGLQPIRKLGLLSVAPEVRVAFHITGTLR